MGFYVPKTMQDAKRWILWRLEDGKKKPYSAIYDGLASTTKPNTWSSYQKAATRYEYGNYNGLGFVFAAGDGLVFIDLDNCVTDEGELSEFAEEIVELFAGTYTEYSQSERGIHIVCCGTIPRAFKSEKIEIYADGRYMAFTGNAYTVAEPRPSQRALDDLCERFDISASDVSETVVQPITATDNEILHRAEIGRNGTEFRNLYYNNVFPYRKADGTPDQSRADLRLIALFVFYGATDEQIHRLFRSSVLGQRNKATADYIQRTINAARQSTNPLTANNRGFNGNISRATRAKTATDTPEQPKRSNRKPK